MTVGILGGAGFVGSGIRCALEQRGVNVTVIELENYKGCVGLSFDVLINANGNSKKFLAVQSPREEFTASVNSVQHSLLDFRFGIYLHLSTVDVYTNHEDPSSNSEDTFVDVTHLSLYGLHKYLAEQIVQRYAEQWIILRCGGFVGAGLKKNSIYNMLNNIPLRVDIDSEYQYLLTDSLGEIILSLINGRIIGEIFNVCGDGCISLRKVSTFIHPYNIRYHDELPRRELYRINIEKIKSYVTVPNSVETVRIFVQEYINKR